MSDYRVYVRSSVAVFNGTSPESATYVQSRYKWTTATTSQVGLWSPSSLGRNNVASLVNVFPRDGLAAPGDTVRVLTASGAVRESTAYQAAGSGWLYMEPDDQLSVTTAASVALDICVNDLAEDQLARYSDSLAIAAAQELYVGSTIVTALSPVTLPASTRPGVQYVLWTAPAAGVANLPASTACVAGYRFVISNLSGANIGTVVAAGGNTIDGNPSQAIGTGTAVSVECTGTSTWIAIVGA